MEIVIGMKGEVSAEGERAEAEVTAVEGNFITFAVSAYDEAGKIGEGTHKRCIVTEQKFLDRTYDKL